MKPEPYAAVAPELLRIDEFCLKCRKRWEAFYAGSTYGFIPCSLCESKLRMSMPLLPGDGN